MSFRLNINENENIIKVRRSFSENVVYEFPYLGRIVDFTVPTSGIYKIEAWGARGGSESSTTGPLGAYSKSFVSLNKGETVQILVGEKGYPGGSDFLYCGGGGGGTFIAKGNAALCVAGGGGSFAYPNSANTFVQSHACGQATQLSANIGTVQVTLKMGGKALEYDGAGGGGFEGNGDDGSSWGKGGISFLNGGARQTQGTTGNYAYGGFGGGGSRSGNCGYGAGGGGYTGGTGSAVNTQGGGGGSYYEGNFSNEALSYAISGCDSNILPNPGTNGNGFAVLTLLKSHLNDVRAKECNYCYQIQFLWTLYSTFISQ
jgi:hypothetical protein